MCTGEVQRKVPAKHVAQLTIASRKARALSCAAREADFDEHRADARNFGCVGHDGREYYPYAP